MSGYQYLRFPEFSGVLSASSATPSADSTERQARKIRKIHRILALVAGCVLCLSGYERAVLSRMSTFDDPSALLAAFATGGYDLSCGLGAIAAIFLGDRLGRKRTLFLSTIVIAIGIALQAGAWKMAPLIAGRVLAGIGNGANTATAATWHVEISTQHTKGKAAVQDLIANVLGFLIARSVIRACGVIDGEVQRLLLILLPLILVIPILGLTLMLPESPRWLLLRGRDAEAKDVLASLSLDDLESEYDIIWTSAQEQVGRTSWSQLLSRRSRASRRMILGVLLQSCQQLTGISALLYSLDLVLDQTIGFSESVSYYTALGLASIYAMSGLGSLKFIESYGRRRLLICGAAVQATALFGVAFCTTIDQGLSSSFIALACISMYATAFGVSWMSIPWVYPVEINSLGMRTKGVALANAMSSIISFGSALTVSPGNNKLGFDTFRGYALLNVCFVPMVYFFLIETAGHSLEKIGTWVEDHPKWLVHKDNLSPPFNGGNRPLDEENANPSDEVQVGPSDEAQPRPSGEDQESSGDSDPSVTAPLEEVDLSSWYAR